MVQKGVELMAKQTKLSILQASPSASQESGSTVSLGFPACWAPMRMCQASGLSSPKLNLQVRVRWNDLHASI